jgi:hypothetical protein
MNKYRLHSKTLAALAAFMLAIRLWRSACATVAEWERKVQEYGPPTPLPFALFILPVLYVAAITTDYYLFQTMFAYIASVSNEELGVIAGWVLPPCIWAIELAVSVMAALQDAGLQTPIHEEWYPEYDKKPRRQTRMQFRWAYLKGPLLLAQVLSAAAMYDALEQLNPDLHTSNMLMAGFLFLFAGVCHYGVLNSGSQLLVLGKNLAGARARRHLRRVQTEEGIARDEVLHHYQGSSHLMEEYRRSYPGDSFNPALDPRAVEAVRIIIGEAPPRKDDDSQHGTPSSVSATPPNPEHRSHAYASHQPPATPPWTAAGPSGPTNPFPQYHPPAQSAQQARVVHLPERPQAPPEAPQTVTVQPPPLPGTEPIAETPSIPVDPRDDNQL